MRFAHVSDFHFTSTPQDSPVIRNDVVEVIETLLTDLRSVEDYLDFIAITGDLTELGDIDSYRKIRTALNSFKIPVHMVPGNHDAREPFRELLSPSSPIPKSGPVDFHVDTGSVQIIALDTLIEGELTGRLTEDQITWLADKLMGGQHSHTVVMMHHPPFATGLIEFDNICTLEGHEKFSELIDNTDSDVTVLCGHVHRPYQALWKGANCYIAGSPAFQIGGEEPFGECELGLVDEPFAYLIHTLGASGEHLVSTRYVNLGVRSDVDNV